VPAVGNTSRYDSSGPIGPDEKAPGMLEVTLCVSVSLFVQQTVVPGRIVTGSGEYVEFVIETFTSLAWQGSIAALAWPPSANASPPQATQMAVRATSAFTTRDYANSARPVFGSEGIEQRM
jgi:hypothetical protein